MEDPQARKHEGIRDDAKASPLANGRIEQPRQRGSSVNTHEEGIVSIDLPNRVGSDGTSANMVATEHDVHCKFVTEHDEPLTV